MRIVGLRLGTVFLVIGVAVGLLTGSMSSPVVAQSPQPDRATLARTVELFRYNWDAPKYVSEWLTYMDFTDYTAQSPESKSAVQALRAMSNAFDATDRRGMRNRLNKYLSTTPPDELASMAVYFYFHRSVDLENAIHPPKQFDTALPAWSSLPGPNSKFFYTFSLMDLAWQSVAEGKPALATAYYERVRDASWRLVEEEPLHPVQVWNVYNYILASVALGEPSVADAITQLKGVVATTEPCVLTWIARYQLAAIPTHFPGIPNEQEDHLAVVLAEVNSGYMDAAFARTDVMRDVKAMLELDAANVISTRVSQEDAVAACDSVLSKYAGCMEWAPRTQGRTIVNPSEYGVLSMTAHNRMQGLTRIHKDNPGRVQTELDGFFTAYPNSEHTDKVLWRLARHREHTKDFDGARRAYRALANDRPFSSKSVAAAERLAAMEARLSAQAK